MPKIVDHEAHRHALAAKAATVFSAKGYGAVGMRAMATELGVSKSALYHYFPTKEALFLAATKAMMAQEPEVRLAPEGTEPERLRALAEAMKVDFGAEMALVFDYLRGKSREEVQADAAMGVALQTYEAMVASVVGEERARDVLVQLMGALLLDALSGGKITAEDAI
ncbi:TetR family transcriptional regulator [Shimia isoporae]|uniref:TetR family transcriptional regulator n=1 Tax=Shimia isoporae TaxID=647720 RepID=A0A4R1N3X2_9RHOB|nr:TetR/AcrR family transcriptional regulator [Shimia isoporae]TCL00375.1 TetR family transcriptional regulator [Shimia isoporae]